MTKIAAARVGVVLGLLLAAVLISPVEAAEVTDRQTTVVRGSTTQPSSAIGMTADVTFHPSPEGRPYSVKKIRVTLPHGFGVDFNAVPICRATDAELYLNGPDACPDSRIGIATAKVDFGMPLTDENTGSPYHVILLGDHELINYEHNQAGGNPGPEQPTVFPLVQRNELTSTGFSINIPEAPTLAGPDHFWALLSAHLEFFETGLFRTAATCPAGGWKITASFDYQDGNVANEIISMPCHSGESPALATAPAPAGGDGGVTLPVTGGGALSITGLLAGAIGLIIVRRWFPGRLRSRVKPYTLADTASKANPS